jgi:5'(3')-deoxyribonucleotidase
MAKPSLFLDVDGVFADFEGAVAALFGMPVDQVPRRRMWARIHRTPGFWSGLVLLPGADRLWAHCAPHEPVFLTGILTGDRTCIPSKVEWVRRHFHTDRVICCSARDKPAHGRPGDVLVDDRASNVEAWEAMGGRGILHRSVDATLEDLRALGFR